MSNLEKVQNVNKSAEETAVELDGEMSMEADLTGKFLTQQVAAVMAKKQNSTKRKLKTGEKWKGWSVSRVGKNGTRGGGRASKKKKTFMTTITMNTKSKTHK